MEMHYLLCERTLEGESVLDLIAFQNNLEILMMEQVQNVISSIWEGPFEVESYCSKLSKNSNIVVSLLKEGPKLDKERQVRWKKHTAKPQGPLMFEIWKQGIGTRFFLEGVFVLALAIYLQNKGLKIVTMLQATAIPGEGSSLWQFFIARL